MKKLISILGSTGSIGLSTLKILDKKKNYFKPYLFSANKNYKLICKQIKKYKPVFFLINDEKVFAKVKKKFKSKTIKIINTLNNKDFKKISDVSVLAIPGIAGLSPTIFMLKKSKKVLLANKESVICGWNIINKPFYKI
jgi:1-deoxy-D-xylulose-5-phosphate reductoisomerase